MFPSSTSTDSASSSSSSSPFSHFRSNNNNNNNDDNRNNNNNNKTMEDVWKDINVASLPNTPLPHTHYNNNNNNNNNNINLNHNSNIINHNNHSIIHHPTPTSNYRGMILQDFLKCNNPSITTIDSPPVYHNYQQQQQQPTTALKLTNEFNQMFDDSQNDYNMRGTQNYSAFGTFDALASSSVLNSFGGVEVVTKNKSTPENANVDHRHKRMIKNRESAARSRARKQAYITELELEVAHLAAENARLRKQQQQLLLETHSTQHPKKQGLRGFTRTLTAPF